MVLCAFAFDGRVFRGIGIRHSFICTVGESAHVSKEVRFPWLETEAKPPSSTGFCRLRIACPASGHLVSRKLDGRFGRLIDPLDRVLCSVVLAPGIIYLSLGTRKL